MENNTQIYGIQTVLEAINAEKPIDKIFIQKGLKGELSKELESLVRRKGISTSYVPAEKLNRLTAPGTIANISSDTKNQRTKIVTLHYKNVTIMDLQADLKWIHQELDTIKDPLFIEAIKNMLKYRKKMSSERISIEQYNKEINESIAQIEKGEFYTHQEVGERIKQWTKQ